MANYIYFSDTYDGWKNLTYDRFFLNNLKSFDTMLYFYINDGAVIIGKNQNAWKELNLDKIDEDNIQVVRRHTGGGAVFHDKGNLNFSFILNKDIYDVEKQLGIIIEALEPFGIHGEISGRNDILVENRKFSGNAFGMKGDLKAHHGTVLVNTDMTRLARYLNVSEKKIKSKGIDSVRARVCNLTDLNSSITVEDVRQSITDVFMRTYGKASEYIFTPEELQQIDKIYREQSSWEYNIGASPKFDYIFEEKLSFGEIQMLFSLENGYIKNVQVFSDALDTSLCDIIKDVLLATKFDKDSIVLKLSEVAYNSDFSEIAEYFRSVSL